MSFPRVHLFLRPLRLPLSLRLRLQLPIGLNSNYVASPSILSAPTFSTACPSSSSAHLISFRSLSSLTSSSWSQSRPSLSTSPSLTSCSSRSSPLSSHYRGNNTTYQRTPTATSLTPKTTTVSTSDKLGLLRFFSTSHKLSHPRGVSSAAAGEATVASSIGRKRYINPSEDDQEFEDIVGRSGDVRGGGRQGWGRQGRGGGSVWKPVLFSVSLSLGAYLLAAYYTNKETSEWTDRLGAGSWWRSRTRTTTTVTDDEIYRAKTLESAKHLQDTLDNLPSYLSFLPPALSTPFTRIYVSFAESYLTTPPSQKVCLSIIAFNGAVFLLWKLPSPRIQAAMRHWWMHWPVGRHHHVITLATSVFSHQSLPHFAFNSIALYSFGSAAYTYLSKPPKDSDYSSSHPSYAALHQLASSTTSYHFLAFFLTAGLFSSLSSHISTVLIRLPRLLRDLRTPGRISSASALAANSAVLPSLGASGAIYATLTMTALAYPEASISLIFVPFLPIPIGWGMAGMVAVDALGVIRGWRMFDHVAHLAGAFFGAVYYAYGKSWWTWLRVQMGAKERKVEV